MGGGGSTTNPVIPQALLQLLGGTVSNVLPNQNAAWKGTWQKNGTAATPQEAANNQAIQTKIDQMQQALSNSSLPPATRASIEAQLAAETEKLAGWTTKPSEFMQKQNYGDYYGSVQTPDTAYAAIEQALGGQGVEGFSAPSVYEGLAASSALQNPSQTLFGQEFTDPNARKMVDFNPAQQELASYAGSSWINPTPGGPSTYVDTRQTAGEKAALTQAGQLQGIGAKTPDLGDFAKNINTNPAIKNALSVWSDVKLPTIQNQASLMGLGRSSSLLKGIDTSQNQFLQPIIQDQLNREENAISRGFTGAQANVAAQQTAAQAQAQREAEDYARKYDIGFKIQGLDQAKADAQQADYLRRQGLNELEVANAMTSGQNQFGNLFNLSQADTQRKLAASQQLTSMAGTERDWAKEQGDFALQDALRRQALGENLLFQPLGGTASMVGSKTTGGK